MKPISVKLNTVRVAAIFGLIALLSACNQRAPEITSNTSQSVVDVPDEIIWHIKAIHPEGRTIDVKALDADGNIYDIKAIQESGQRQVMDIKAFVGEDRLPVKMLLSDDQYAPVKAITEDGTIYDIKALPEAGSKLDVKGVSRSGNIVDLKAIDSQGKFYGVKAISPEGQLNDVKGVKMLRDSLEGIVNGVKIYAHVKALPQTK